MLDNSDYQVDSHQIGITYRKIVVPKFRNQGKPPVERDPNSLANLNSDQLILNELSKNSQRKLQARLGWLIWKHTYECKSRYQKIRKLKVHTAFITLTLSSAQRHQDHYITKHLLGSLLDRLRKDYGKISYVWRAEKQKNGNIHYHILANKRIHWKKVRYYWNQIQKRHGYIEPFKEKFGHEDPNSIDVHGLMKVGDVLAYMEKYMSKDQDEIAISGRLWGCSQDLSKLDACKVRIHIQVLELLQNLAERDMIGSYSNDYVIIYTCDVQNILRMYLPEVFDYVTEWCQKAVEEKPPDIFNF